MVASKAIRVMISSRCDDPIDLHAERKTLSDLRVELKQAIESTTFFDRAIFECWINEDAPAAEGTEDSWSHCLKQVKEADIVIALYNGNAGWAKGAGDIGICHAELETALASGAAKVRLIQLPLIASPTNPGEKARNSRFRGFVVRQSLFRGAEARNGDQAIELAKQTLHDALIEMVKLGSRETRKGKYDTGQALDWSRLDFKRRKSAMEKVVRDNLLGQADAKEDNGHIFLKVSGRQVLFQCHAIPAAVTISAAREMVGRPFLRDHALVDLLQQNRVGPVHLIACHKSVTESQAISLLGFPDATIVPTAFGVYVADNIQKIQIVFLANCRDETSTRHAVQRVFEWLDRSGEAEFLAERASARKNIVKVIAKESSEKEKA